MSTPTLFRMFVLEVISDPTSVTKDKIDYWEYVFGIDKSKTKKYALDLPRNTIIAQRQITNSTLTKPTFLFPLFPSHLALPCKAGELVWAIYENAQVSTADIGYWIGKISFPHSIDDVNHTHVPDLLNKDFSDQSTLNKFTGNNQRSSKKLYNGVVDENGTINVKSRYLSGDEYVFERLTTDTDASNLTYYEAVPRFKKRPGDIVLEGSNNSLIVLGTDRMSSEAEYFKLSAFHPISDFSDSAGSIDIVTGRGAFVETGGLIEDIVDINSEQPLMTCLNKSHVQPQEGNPDWINDRSRVLISQKTKTDTKFSTNGYLQKFNIFDNESGDASIVIKSDKIRIIARSDISLIVTNFQDKTGNFGSMKTDNFDVSRWASITIKADGNIIFSPSKEGFIKLGGDDADKAILCTDNLTFPPSTEGGKVTYSQGILTSGADVVGTGEAGKGTFASKVLVK